MLRLGKSCLDVGLRLVKVEKKLRCQSEKFYVFNERLSGLESHLQVMGIKKAIEEFLSHTCLILGFNVKPYPQINVEVFYLNSIGEIFNAMKQALLFTFKLDIKTPQEIEFIITDKLTAKYFDEVELVFLQTTRQKPLPYCSYVNSVSLQFSIRKIFNNLHHIDGQYMTWSSSEQVHI